MKNFSKNKKLNGLLNDIRDELLELGIEEILHYHDEFKGQANDFNIVEYGNLLIYRNPQALTVLNDLNS